MVITADASGTAGTPHDFLCSIMVPTAVNTSVTAEVTWFGPGFGSGRDSTTPIMSVDGSNMFTSTLQLSPLSTADTGLYTCSVTLSSAGDSTFITPSVAGNDSESLDVTGKNYHLICSFNCIVLTIHSLKPLRHQCSAMLAPSECSYHICWKIWLSLHQKYHGIHYSIDFPLNCKVSIWFTRLYLQICSS